MSAPGLPAEGTAEDPPRCGCGFDRDHFMVSAEPQYSGVGWFWVLFGITTVPREIQFRCRRCKVCFDRTQDERIMKRLV